MKKLSDHKGEEAIELWVDLLEPMTNILGDTELAGLLRSKAAPLLKAQGILKAHKQDAMEIMLRIDPTPINGLNILTRLVAVILEFTNNPDLKDFFVSAGQEKMEKGSSGNAMESIEAEI